MYCSLSIDSLVPWVSFWRDCMSTVLLLTTVVGVRSNIRTYCVLTPLARVPD
jgi:hypothetical protein